MNAVAAPNLLEYVLIVLLGGGYGMPSAVPPTAEDPLAAKVAPAECLFYASWAGTATPDATSGNQTEQLFAEPEIRDFLTRSRGRMLGPLRISAAGSPEARQAMDDGVRLLELVEGKPGALFISEIAFEGNGPPTVKGGAIIRLDDDAAEAQALIDRILTRSPETKVTKVQLGSHTFSRVKFDEDAPAITWGLVGKHLYVGVGDGSMEGLLERSEGQAPKWLTDVRAGLPVPRVSSTVYVDVKRLVDLAVRQSDDPTPGRIIAALGLDKIQSFATVSGLDDRGFVSRSLLAVDGAGAGLLSWIDAKPLAADDLKMIAYDAPAAVAFKLDPSWLMDVWLDAAEQAGEAEQIRRDLAQAERQLGFNVQRDLLGSLGDAWRIFIQPGSNELVDGLTIAIQVRDREKLERVQKTLLALMKSELERGGPGAPSLTEDTVNGHAVHTMEFGQMGVPIAPSWCLTDGELIIAATPAALKPLLEDGRNDRSLAERPEVAALLGGDANTLALAYVDTREVAKVLLPLVPGLVRTLARGMPLDTSTLPSAEVFMRHLQPSVFAVGRTPKGMSLLSRRTLPGVNVGASVPVLAALSFPAIGAARQAANRSQSMNNLKQIALALHNFHDTFRGFPAGYSADKDGKPLLSWRVYILPFVEEGQLYDQFHLDEPWDSPHNKALIDRMPRVYRSPQSKNKAGMTNYLGVSGADGVFVRPRPGGKPGDHVGTSFAQIRDGTSNTVMVVEVPDESAVIWTKPGDFSPNKEDPTKGLIGPRGDGFLAAFADGSVRFLAKTINSDTLNALFTKSGGEVVNVPY